MKTAIQKYLPAECPWGDTLHWFDTIDSTNVYAKQLAAAGAPHGTVVLANHQTAGRGRMGRSFSSPEGMGIYLSVILRPNMPARDLMHLTCAAGVAMCDAVESVSGFRPGVKWINDLVAQKRKLGGILTELSFVPNSDGVQYAIIGIGINCHQKTEDFPPEIRDIALSLDSLTGKTTDKFRLAAAMIHALWKMSASLFEKAEIMTAYRKDCITLGKEVKILHPQGEREGIAEDIDDDGCLLVRLCDGTVEAVNFGEVSIRGMYGYV